MKYAQMVTGTVYLSPKLFYTRFEKKKYRICNSNVFVEIRTTFLYVTTRLYSIMCDTLYYWLFSINCMNAYKYISKLTSHKFQGLAQNLIGRLIAWIFDNTFWCELISVHVSTYICAKTKTQRKKPERDCNAAAKNTPLFQKCLINLKVKKRDFLARLENCREQTFI